MGISAGFVAGRSSATVARGGAGVATTAFVGSLRSLLGVGSLRSLLGVGSLRSLLGVGSLRSLLGVGSLRSLLGVGSLLGQASVLAAPRLAATPNCTGCSSFATPDSAP